MIKLKIVNNLLEKLILNGFLEIKNIDNAFKCEIAHLYLEIQKLYLNDYCKDPNKIILRKVTKKIIKSWLSLLFKYMREVLVENYSLHMPLIKKIYKVYFYLKWKKIY